MNRYPEVFTAAGNGQRGFRDGFARDSIFDNPRGICAAHDGRLYIADHMGNRIRMLHNDQVTTIAGSGQRGYKDGNALEAMFFFPIAVCISRDRKIFVSDHYNHRIRMIYNNTVTTIAGNGRQGFEDGNALDAMFANPHGLCISKDGRLYVADSKNNRIRMIYDSQVTTIAGSDQEGLADGKALQSMFAYPSGICISNDGILYVADFGNNLVRMIDNGQVTTMTAKQGSPEGPMIPSPIGICTTNDGRIFVSSNSGHKITMIYNDEMKTIAGSYSGSEDGKALQAKFSYPWAICASSDGGLYVTDSGNHKIRVVTNLGFSLGLQTFGFGHLLEMREVLYNSQISLHNNSYDLHSALINIRCPELFDKRYLNLIEESGISANSFELFINFLYSNRLTTEYNEIVPAIAISAVVELIFIFDLFMNCKWIMRDLDRRFQKLLYEMLKRNEQKSLKSILVELLPLTYNLKEIIKKKPATSSISYTQYCYNVLINRLQQRKPLIEELLSKLDENFPTTETDKMVVKEINLEPNQVEPLDDESLVTLQAELTDLSILAFGKTNFGRIDKMETNIKLISTEHLSEWTKPDHVITLSNDDREYHVHKLILCGRWKYFSLMIQSGFKEAQDNRVTLSEDWSRTRFEKFMKYIYLNEIDFDELDDAAWLMENGKLYGIIIETENKETPNQEINDENNQTPHMETKQTAAYGFEALYEHCDHLLRKF